MHECMYIIIITMRLSKRTMITIKIEGNFFMKMKRTQSICIKGSDLIRQDAPSGRHRQCFYFCIT